MLSKSTHSPDNRASGTQGVTTGLQVSNALTIWYRTSLRARRRGTSDFAFDPKLTDPHERTVHRFAAALVAGTKLSDSDFAEIEKVLGRNGIAEVISLLGYYTSVGLAMKVHEVPIPQPA